MEEAKELKLKELLEYILKFEFSANPKKLQEYNYTSETIFLIDKILNLLTEEQKQTLLTEVVNWKIAETNIEGASTYSALEELQNKITELNNLLN